MATGVTAGSGQAARATKGTEAVEIKVILASRHEDKALRTFGLRRDDAEQRCIFFYDTRELDLYEKGVVLRARKLESDGDSTVKIRPVAPDRVAERWRKKDGFELQADVVGKKAVRAASFTRSQRPKEIDEVASGERPIEKLFSGDPEEFLGEMSRVRVDWSRLVALGPVAARRWEFEHAGLPYDLYAEEWRLADGRDVVEISIEASPEEAAAAQAALDAFLTEQGLAAQPGQETKTRMLLESFAKRR